MKELNNEFQDRYLKLTEQNFYKSIDDIPGTRNLIEDEIPCVVTPSAIKTPEGKVFDLHYLNTGIRANRKGGATMREYTQSNTLVLLLSYQGGNISIHAREAAIIKDFTPLITHNPTMNNLIRYYTSYNCYSSQENKQLGI